MCILMKVIIMSTLTLMKNHAEEGIIITTATPTISC